MTTKYESYTLQAPARAIYLNATEASKPRNVLEAKTKYSVTLGLEEADAKALFELQAKALKEAFGAFTQPDDYMLACISGAKAAARAIQAAELSARGKPEEERFKLIDLANKRAELFKPYAGILTASSRISAHDRFLERYQNDLDSKERDRVDSGMGFKLAAIVDGKIVALDNALAYSNYKERFYRGGFYGGSFSFKAWPRKTADGKDGVTAYLKTLVFVKDGERLASERPLADEFSHYMGVATSYSPAAAADAHDF